MKKNITERELIDFIRSMTAESGRDVIKGIGDDCAVIRGSSEKLWLLTTDTLVESVHFDLAWHPPYLLGRKTAAVNISDIAAMGGRPKAALLSMALPDSGAPWLDDFIAGFLALLKEQGAGLIGGDTVKSRAEAVFNVTVLGEVEEKSVLYRSGAAVDDTIWVSGYLGEAAAGLELMRKRASGAGEREEWSRLEKAHLNPEPRTRLGRFLAEINLVHAMMDISDGLATDLAHMCAASRVGAEIEAKKLPISIDLAAAAEYLSVSSLDLVLKGGEDYQLLFTVPAVHDETIRCLVAEAGEGEIFPVGRIVAGNGVHLLHEDGQREEITYQGYDHFGSSTAMP